MKGPHSIACALVAVLLAGCSAPAEPHADLSRLHAISYGTANLFPDLVLEIDYVEGREPDDRAIRALVTAIREITDKREIIIEGPDMMRPEVAHRSDLWSIHKDSLETMTASNTTFGTGTAAVLHIVYLGGDSPESTHLNGVQRPGVLYIFPDSFRPREGSPAHALGQTVPDDSPFQVERAVLIHEFGHAIGLVNNGAPMTVARDDGSKHSTNEDSVMRTHPAAGRPSPVEDLPFTFDDADRQDIVALRKSSAVAG